MLLPTKNPKFHLFVKFFSKLPLPPRHVFTPPEHFHTIQNTFSYLFPLKMLVLQNQFLIQMKPVRDKKKTVKTSADSSDSIERRFVKKSSYENTLLNSLFYLNFALYRLSILDIDETCPTPKKPRPNRPRIPPILQNQDLSRNQVMKTPF